MRSDLRLLIILPGLLALAACGGGSGAPPREGDRPVPVTLQVVRTQPWSDALSAVGTVKARESITVTAKVSETVQRVHFDSGDHVPAGAPLVTLSGQAQAAQLAEAQAAAAEAEQQYRRLSELAAQRLVARSQLDTQRAARDAARARVAEVRAAIGDRVIRAPFAGVLGIRQISPGALITPGTAIATLDDVGRVYVDFPVPEAALAQLAPGRRVVARSPVYPARAFEGEVEVVDARVDPATRAVTVRAAFENADRALRTGMLLEVLLLQPERQALVVPEIALVQVGTDTFVYRASADGSVERVGVKVGARRDGRAEILSGLKPGERIVVDGTGKLREGSKVVEAGARTPPERGRGAGR
ncbi:MAG TPA: efflux RND transporter periplasmic adaptor subunit [Lysobacter sp.]|nr:efflux RND transporter periplasmic adaptor subunit [Lysobacter sp.]